MVQPVKDLDETMFRPTSVSPFVMRLPAQFGPCAGAIRADGWELKDSHYSEAVTTVAFNCSFDETDLSRFRTALRPERFGRFCVMSMG
jgi:hypothetical protein